VVTTQASAWINTVYLRRPQDLLTMAQTNTESIRIAPNPVGYLMRHECCGFCRVSRFFQRFPNIRDFEEYQVDVINPISDRPRSFSNCGSLMHNAYCFMHSILTNSGGSDRVSNQ
jgi:hypothetical protein